MDRDFWVGKRILVTGHTGFKGAWLSLWLQQLKANVFGYSLPPPTSPSLFELADVASGMDSHIGDIRDFSLLEEYAAKVTPEIIVHLAAQPLVRYSYEDPYETYTTNVTGTLNVLNLIRKVNGIRVAVVVTSDKCYENREWRWGYRENDTLGGHDPYSSSKACAELLTKSFRNSYFPIKDCHRHNIAIATVRAGNVIGGGDWGSDRLIPDIFRSYESDRDVFIRNPYATRPWQHVLEPLCGYMMLVEKMWSDGAGFSDAWNFGPGENEAQTVHFIVDKLVETWPGAIKWSSGEGEHPHEAKSLRLDSTKAREELNWTPVWGIDTTILSIVDWYKAYYDQSDMRSFTQKQISGFENEISKKR